MNQTEILKKCFSFMDLTTLHPEDTPEDVKKLVDKVTLLQKEYPSYPLPASVCVFPNLANVVHEIDIVLALNKFLAGDLAGASEEIVTMKKAIDAAGAKAGRKIVLKVILETGLLKTPELIRKASMLAMEAGADFIKTSTGKVSVNATPEAAKVMCEAIRDYYKATGRKVGFKAAGGIATAEDALVYYNIGLEILGEEWLNKDYFRYGVSRVGNALMSAIEGKEVKFF